MKRIYSLLTAVILTTSAFAQAPEKMSYQAVVRDAGNALITSQIVGMQISILQGSISGSAVYVETQTQPTNANGLVSLEIGTGNNVSGDFTTINWSNGPYFIKIETDPTGGMTYTISGISQLMSVPYAFYAKTSGSSIPGPQGDAGIDGVNGADGVNGVDGVDGLDGDPGADGAPGTNFFSAMQGGTQNVGASGGLEIIIVNVVFTTPFVGTPSVICTASAQVGSIFDDSFDITTRQVTSTGFTMIINRVDGSTWGQNMDVHWMAFE